MTEKLKTALLILLMFLFSLAVYTMLGFQIKNLL